MAERHSWDDVYEGNPPWDIGRPQKRFAELARDGKLAGDVLDSGCGTGEHTLLAAQAGANALGVDISARAVAMARQKAEERGVHAEFVCGSTLELERLGRHFDVVIDSGMFHVFDDADRTTYVASLAAAVRPGGKVYLMCFSDEQPGQLGPRRVAQAELREAFAAGWVVESIEPAAFEVRHPELTTAKAWFATIRREEA